MKTNTLSPEMLHKIDAYWRAANYLSVGQIYLYDNPLLKRPLTLADVKHMLLGHWGTTPGQNFIYVHLNRSSRNTTSTCQRRARRERNRAGFLATPQSRSKPSFASAFTFASPPTTNRPFRSRCPPEHLGVDFVSLSEALDLTMPAGRAMAGLLAVLAEFEREILRERVRVGLAHARQNGQRLGRLSGQLGSCFVPARCGPPCNDFRGLKPSS
jgi:XFP N-terminal domain/Resolvase, N terminal domain